MTTPNPGTAELEKRIEELMKEFDRQFVKDNGPYVEPSFSDPIGQVGPVKFFIRETIQSERQQAKQEFAKELRKELWRDLHNAQAFELKDHVMNTIDALLGEEAE